MTNNLDLNTKPIFSEVNIAGTFPLTAAQESIWLEQQLASGPAYNMPEAWRLKGSLNVSALQQALNDLVDRHESLRTLFRVENGRPVQIVLQTSGLPLVQEAATEEILYKQMTTEAARPFDLTTAPLVRAVLYKLSREHHVLLITMHHIVSDAWSQAVFVRDLCRLYRWHLEGEHGAADLPALPVQFADYAVWQRENQSGANLKTGLNYWTEQLKGTLVSASPPPDFQQTSAKIRPGKTHFHELGAQLVSAAIDLSRKHNVTLFVTLLAAFKALLHRHSGVDDLTVGCPMAGRDQVETENLVGMFVNTHAFRTQLHDDPTFVDLLGRERQTVLDAFAHQQTPLDAIIHALQSERAPNRHPLFQVVFGLQSQPNETFEMPGLRMDLLELDNSAAKFDWTVLLTRTDTGIRIRSEHDSTLYSNKTIDRLVHRYEMLLEQITQNPNRRLSEYSLITDEERRTTVIDWNNTHSTYERDLCVHELFEIQATGHPDRVALTFKETTISYGELSKRSDELASELAVGGVKAGDRVALLLNRSPELVAAMLAVLKVGAAYVPLDPSYPEERIRFMLQDCSAVAVFESGRLRRIAENSPPRVKNPAVTPNSAAYVMYTSGSTGRPKGVAIPHRAIVRLVRNTNYLRINEGSVFLQLSSPSFDASTLETWGPLLNGARLAIVPHGLPGLNELGKIVQEKRVTILWLTAGLFNQMVDFELESLASVEQLLTGGEAVSVPHALKFLKAQPSCTLINGYGPTENTTFSCCYRIPSNWAGGPSVPIGRPIANSQAYVLDSDQRPCPIGVPGELYVGGDGLGLEYVGQPALTKEKFVQVPLSNLKSQSRPHSDAPRQSGCGQEYIRLYRTGDRVRWLEDGAIEFLGRLDNQVKIRGFRIEPGEIEASLQAHPKVSTAVVTVMGSGINRQLAGYYVSGPEHISPAELLAYLRGKLPNYMVPGALIELPSLPLTINGKVDRAALPSPSVRVEGEIVGPRTEQEQLVCQVWKEVLGHNGFDVHQNFFQIGGHSLLATQVASRLSQILGTDVPVRTLFECSTIETLAAALPAKGWGRADEPALTPSGNKARAKKLLEQIDQLSEEELDKLLRECS